MKISLSNFRRPRPEDRTWKIRAGIFEQNESGEKFFSPYVVLFVSPHPEDFRMGRYIVRAGKGSI